MNTSAPGISCSNQDWQKKTLPNLIAGIPHEIPAQYLGLETMSALVKQRLFDRGLLVEGAEYLCLEIDGEMAEFGVVQLGDEFICYENREAKPRVLRLPLEDLRLYTLNRERFYALLAKDLGISVQVLSVSKGVWELGRKSTSEGRAKVLFVESGVSDAELRLLLHTDRFATICVLHHGAIPVPPKLERKTIVCASVEFVDGRMVTDAFMDLDAICVPRSETEINLEATPPELWICGEKFKLPTSIEGEPTDGCRYLAHLFDHAYKPITCWDLYLAIRPEEKEKIGGPSWSDEALDQRGRSEFKAQLQRALAELHEIEMDLSMPAKELSQARKKVEELQEQATKLFGKGGRSRQIVEGDRGKARQRVRKALKLVIEKIQNQDANIGLALAEALGEGDPVTFRPPPDWRV